MNMTYEEVIEKLLEVEDLYIEGFDWVGSKKARRRVVTGNEYVSVEWTTGGITGNSCYGENPTSVRAESPRELEDLEKILEVLCPNITYLQAKRIERRVDFGERSSYGDYYGNYYDYAVKTLRLKDLHKELSAMNLI